MAQSMAIAVVFLSGCSKVPQPSRVTSRNDESQHQLQARLVDIPIAPGTVSSLYDRSAITADGSYMFRYMTTLCRDEVVAFYRREMERLGWECIASVNAYQDCFVFMKPKRVCVIDIQPRGQHVRISLSIGRKSGD